ncbi:hypothetical protein WG908_06290 [Sphingobium sp. AN641]|uniref:hypothetical protein n=1 Tax=Sphingobium sp. AN641 TaxID=3133443 RepID=UPI0030C5E6F7
MCKVIAFPGVNLAARIARIEPSGDNGIVHVWQTGPGQFEIGHESRSGSSWGHFETFDNPGAAVAGAHRLNRRLLGGECEVFVPAAIRALLPKGGAA